MEKLSTELCQAGDLSGLLVTGCYYFSQKCRSLIFNCYIYLIGNSKYGLKILQKYLDHTSDIQSTTIIAVRAFSDYLSTSTVQNWIVKYD